MMQQAVMTLRARLEPARGDVARPAARREPVHRPARVALMLALAHRIERQIASGELADRAQAARTLGLTSARVSQLCDLLLLAPDIQDELLFLESIDGVEPITERALRPISAEPLWSQQRARWAALRAVAIAGVWDGKRGSRSTEQVARMSQPASTRASRS